MIRIAVCDDDREFAARVEALAGEVMENRRSPFDICKYTDGRMLAADIEEGLFFDLLLLDIEMPKQDGMTLAGQVRAYLPEALILFVTSHTKYAVKAFELSIFRYIPKTELEACLPLALCDACRLLEQKTEDCYLIESPRKVVKIPIDRIVCVCKAQKYSVIVWSRRGGEGRETIREEVSVRKPLGQILEELNREEFLLIERGYLVNLCQVEKMEGQQVFMSSGDILPVSRGHMKDVREALTRFWRKRL